MELRTWDYLEEYRQERRDIIDAVDQVFSSGRLILGESVRRFEAEFARFHGVAHCVGVDNGTNALVLGLRVLGVGPGDEVVTVANTAPQTVVAIDAVGAVPVFVDIDPETHLMDTSRVAEAITPRTTCLLPVHLFGQCVPMEPLEALAAERGLAILEDCAQAHGARRCGRPAGAMGDLGAFSFYPTKVLGGYGDGGAVLTGDPASEAALRRLRYCGMGERCVVEDLPALNSRLDEVQAEILRRKLRRLQGYVERRRAIARRYDEGLAGTELVLPRTAEGNDHAYYLYVVRHPRRDALLEELRRRAIALNVHYRRPVHMMDAFAPLGYAKGSLPATETAAEEVFSLPMYPSLTECDQDRAIEEIRRAMAVV